MPKITSEFSPPVSATSANDDLRLIQSARAGMEPETMENRGRDLMAPDTEPTDEELALVMREARDLALARKAISDEWMRRQMAAAIRAALGQPDDPADQ